MLQNQETATSQYPLFILDAFTQTLFGGNQAAVVLLPKWLPEPTMQAIAAENQLAETAFVVPLNDAAHYQIRWFSPLKEIDFCGHATLAAAWVLLHQQPQWERVYLQAQAVGTLEVARQADRLQMRFPNRAPQKMDAAPAALLAGLSIEPQEVWRNQQAYFAVYANAADVRALQTDDASLKQLAPYDVVATAAANGAGHDFVSRYFWPANGGTEDAATGSIHAGLAPFWADRLGKTTLNAYQASQRGAHLFCMVEGDFVFVSGQCVPYLSGQISLPTLDK